MVRRIRRTGFGLAGWLCAAVLGACTEEEPEQALIRLDSPDRTQAVLVTSTDFTVQGGTTTLIQADTVTVSLPFEQVYPLGSPARFYSYASFGDSLPATLALTIFIDERQWFADSRRLNDPEPAGLEFTYRWSTGLLF